MGNRPIRTLILTGVSIWFLALSALGESDLDAERAAELSARADVEESVMVPMRDGVRLATDIYRPKNAEGTLPIIFWRTPYNFHELKGSRLLFALAAVKNGYAFAIQNERGKFHSEGEWEILGFPRTDGYDALSWLAEQSWSNGRVGTIGCSSSAEWQLALAATDHPAHAAMIPMASGAGIGRVGEFYEQGNWYRGGVEQMFYLPWLYWVQNTQRPRFDEDLSDEDRVRLASYFDLSPDMPEVDWKKKLWHLPVAEAMHEASGPKGMFSEYFARKPNDPSWYEGGLYHDDEDWGVPTLWFNSCNDVSIGPNLALFRHTTENASDPEVRDNQYAIVAPTLHCRYFQPSWDLDVGERNVGDASFDYEGLIFDFFDRWLKGEDNGFEEKTPKVTYYAMGENEWRTSDSWPPSSSHLMSWYLDSDEGASSIFGDGRLISEASSDEGRDDLTYDPSVPVPSLGGGICCIGGAIEGGSFDQRPIEARADVLIYTSDVLTESLDVSGPVRVELFVSSDVRDTDFTVKLIDVYPDGRAYNLDETILRARYRDGFDHEVFMEEGEIYPIEIGPMVTSNVFLPGHRIRLEISSSNFPRFARNLNTGGANFNESEYLVAHNVVHHSGSHPSRIVLTVVDPEGSKAKVD